MKNKLCIIFAVFLLAAVLSSCGNEPIMLGDYSEFDLEGVESLPEEDPSSGEVMEVEDIIPEETEVIEKEIEEEKSIVTGIDNPQDIFSCSSDDDCVLIQPDKCCACPVAVNKDAKRKIETLSIGRRAQCDDDFLCGTCLPNEKTMISCVENRCITKITPDEETTCTTDYESDYVHPEDIVTYPQPEIPADSNFVDIQIKPACQPGTHRHAVYLRYVLKKTSATAFEVREESEENYKTIFELGPLYEVENTIVLCDDCRITGTPSLELGKKYYLRIKSTFKDEITYSGNYIIDTRHASEYIQNDC